MCIYSKSNRELKLTWLYIKQHAVTGLLYLGKTSRPDVNTYLGSGTYWIRHRKVHGNHINTIWCKQFNSIDEISEYADFLSTYFNVSDSVAWANLKPENGLDGGSKPGTNKGSQLSAERKLQISNKLKGRKFTDSHRSKIVESWLTREPATAITRDKMTKAASKPKSDAWKKSASERRKGVPKTDEQNQKNREAQLKRLGKLV